MNVIDYIHRMTTLPIRKEKYQCLTCKINRYPLVYEWNKPPNV